MFGGRRYAVREELGIGASYGVYRDDDTDGDTDEPLLTTSTETLAIKEDFRFSDPKTGEEVLWVKAESVLDIAAAYDVIDERTGEYVGSIERSVSSFLKHGYTVYDHHGDELATIEEDSWPKAVVRRKVTSALPFEYRIDGPDSEAYGTISEGLSFRDSYSIELEPVESAENESKGVDIADADTGTDLDAAATKFDPRLAVVSIVIIDAIEDL